MYFFFFFQAEDGIRDRNVTGVQTCALPILRAIREEEPAPPSQKLGAAEGLPALAANRGTGPAKLARLIRGELDWIVRSEERRVGKEWRSGWGAEDYKKKDDDERWDTSTACL